MVLGTQLIPSGKRLHDELENHPAMNGKRKKLAINLGTSIPRWSMFGIFTNIFTMEMTQSCTRRYIFQHHGAIGIATLVIARGQRVYP